jgi:DNA helicase II / ATP-dependent DNA helicase PcrA
LITKVFGPPGSGKTNFLLSIVEQELASGINPMDMGYFAFTRKAATEARDRAIQKFPHLNAKTDFPWFRTLHSLAYHCLGVSNKDLMSGTDYAVFAKETGLKVSANVETGEDFIVQADNAILNEINIARIRSEDLRTHYNKSDMEIEWFHFEFVERAYRRFKAANMLMDFTDLLERVAESPERLPELKVLIIDEAQDLSRLQWKLVTALQNKAERTYIAGDDDQAVFNWAGADVQSFLSYDGQVKVLNQSYRVPAKVHQLADTIVNRIQNRQEKKWSPRSEKGEIHYYSQFEQVDISKGEWLIMASTNYMLNDLHTWIKSQGLLFERQGQRSIADSVVAAVVGWERLRKGLEINYDALQKIYKNLPAEAVKRGFKSLRTAEPDKMYSMQNLKDNHGLLTDEVWHKALTKIGEDKRAYLISVLRRGIKLSEQAPIRLSTIHGAKGGEADNVLLMTDLSPRFAKDYARNADDINRLLYVGVTRTRKTLHIVLPKNEQKGFRF